MRTLPAQRLRARDYVGMEQQLAAIFREIIFSGVVEIAEAANPLASSKLAELANAGEDVLREALRTGRVQYANGVFSGLFKRGIADAIRDLGGKFDARAGVYRINPGVVPGWVRVAAEAYLQSAKAAHEAILRKLDEVSARLDAAVEARPVDAGATVQHVVDGFKTSAEALEVMPELSSDGVADLAKGYSQNMALWIKKFSEQQILDLRELVEGNAVQGYRFDRLVHGIRDRYKVAQSKAEFLARQETSLFMSKFRQERFKDVGVKRYIWSGSMDARERPDHRLLENKVFFYAQPPVVDRASGRRGNPGEDYNCRCVDIPILDNLAVAD